MKTKLDAAELSIERSAGSYRPVSSKDRKHIEVILTRSRKSRSITIRISEPTLAELKQRAEREGLPYRDPRLEHSSQVCNRPPRG